jgi:hypothetical protein
MQRPVSVNVFGILNIVFALFGFFSAIGAVGLLSATDAAQNNPVVRIMLENPTYAAWMKLSIPLGLVASVVLLATGIGLLRLKSWARKLSIAYAIYAILFGIAGTVISYLFLVRALLAEAQQSQGPEAAAAMGGAIGGIIAGALGLVYPILLIIFMTRPKVVAAFQRPEPPPMPSST